MAVIRESKPDTVHLSVAPVLKRLRQEESWLAGLQKFQNSLEYKNKEEEGKEEEEEGEGKGGRREGGGRRRKGTGSTAGETGHQCSGGLQTLSKPFRHLRLVLICITLHVI